jgi:hypothetical protein
MENTQMTAIPKGTATARIKAEMEQTIEEEGLEEYVRVYTDESLMENQVGCAIICETREIKIRLQKQMSIVNAEAVAILEAIKATRRWGIAKNIILTDSLSNLMAQTKCKRIQTKTTGATLETSSSDHLKITHGIHKHNPYIGRPLSRIVVPLIYFFLYTNLIHGCRINDEIRPLCTDCNQDNTVDEHILWQYPNYDIRRSRSNISREALLGNNKEELKMVIKYLKEIGLVHYI